VSRARIQAGTWRPVDPTCRICPIHPCGRFVDTITIPYRTLWWFGTDQTQYVEIQWEYCQPGALALGFSTPFVSRRHDFHEIWPPIGEIQYAQRPITRPREAQVSILDGTHAPCGDPLVWAQGYQGTIPEDYPLNAFCAPLCCQGPMGTASLGATAYFLPNRYRERSSGGLEAGSGRVRYTYDEASAGGLEAGCGLVRYVYDEASAGGQKAGCGLVRQVYGEASRGGLEAGTSSSNEYTPGGPPEVINYGGGVDASTTSCGFFWTATTTTGSTLIIAVTMPLEGVTASLPPGWTSLGTMTNLEVTLSLFIYRGAPSMSSLTIALSSEVSYVAAVGYEVVNTSGTVDVVAQSTPSATFSPAVGPTGTLAAAAEVALVFVCCKDAGGSITALSGGFSSPTFGSLQTESLGIGDTVYIYIAGATYVTATTSAISTTGTTYPPFGAGDYCMWLLTIV